MKTLHAIGYQGGQIFVDNAQELQLKESGYVAMISVWGEPTDPRIVSVTDRVKNEYVIKAKKVTGDLNHADINGTTWATVNVRDCSGKIIAQSPNLSLEGIPYVEIGWHEIKYLHKPSNDYYTLNGAGGLMREGGFTNVSLPLWLKDNSNDWIKCKVISIEVEIKDWCDYDDNPDGSFDKPDLRPVTYTKDGKTFLKVEKVNYE